jgi:CBS domain-containing protein
MRVADMIKGREQVYSVQTGTTVLAAARYLRDKEVRATTVCNSQGEPVGVISQSDISDQVAASDRLPSAVMVDEIMSPGLITVAPETPLHDCLRLLEQKRIYHLVVIGEGKRLCGMISAQDLLKALAADEKERADFMQAWAFPPR